MIADLLAGLTDAEIQAIGDGSTTLELEAGARIFGPGDPATSLFIVYNGEVEISPDGLAQGNRGVLLGPGEFFGEIALIEGHSHTSLAVTTQTTSLLELHWQSLEQIMDSNPIILRNLNRALADRLRQTDRRLMRALLQLADESDRLYQRAATVLSVSRQVADLLDWNELWQKLLDSAMQTLNAERGTVYLLNETNGNLEGMVIRGIGLNRITVPRGQGIAGSCVLLRQPILVADAPKDGRFYPKIDEMTGYSTRATICSPFKSNNGKILGVIQLINSNPDSFSHEDLSCLSLFADQFGMGYERSHIARKLIDQAESNLVTDIIEGIKRALPVQSEGSSNLVAERFFQRISLAHSVEFDIAAKPLRFRTFLENLIQEIIAGNSEIGISIVREKIYEGFITVDSKLFSAALEGLLIDLGTGGNQLMIHGVDQGESLRIGIENGAVPEDDGNRRPLSFQAAQKFVALHKGSFTGGKTEEGKFSVTLSLPLTG